MKKMIVIIGAICIILLGTSVCANERERVEGVKVNYPIIMDGFPIEKDIDAINVGGRTYLQLRDMCEALKLDIEWTEDREVKIWRDEEEYPEVYFEITEGMAVKFAEAFLEDFYIDEYLKKMEFKAVDKTGESYIVRWGLKEYGVLGGDTTVEIGKKDGRIIEVKGWE